LCLYVLLLPFITTAAFSGVINDDDDDDYGLGQPLLTRDALPPDVRPSAHRVEARNEFI